MDNPQSQADVGGSQTNGLSAGTRLPRFRPGRDRPSPFSAEDLNRLVDVANAFTCAKWNIVMGAAPDGSANNLFDFKLTPDGAVITLYLGNLGSSSPGGTTPMTYAESYDNYIACSYNGNTTYVAKPWWLQRATYTALSPLTLPDNVHTYAYHSADRRTDSTPDPISGTIVSESLIVPPYIAGGIIQAVQPEGGTGLVDLDDNPIIWQDSNEDARKWKNQVQICYTNPTTNQQVQAYIWIDTNPYANSLW